MNSKVITAVLIGCIFYISKLNAGNTVGTDFIPEQRIDSLIESSLRNKPAPEKAVISSRNNTSTKSTTQKEEIIRYVPLDLDDILNQYEENKIIYDIPVQENFLKACPFFRELTFNGYDSKPFRLIKYPTVGDLLESQIMHETGMEKYLEMNFMQAERNVQELRNSTVRKMTVLYPEKVIYRADKLPDVKDLVGLHIDVKPIDKTIALTEKPINPVSKKIVIDKPKRNPWLIKSMAMLQFSQSYISTNWYQGGGNNASVLGILNGQFNYDNKKDIQWENFAEWRLGVNTTDGDKLRMLNTNDDIFRINSKLGIKASGNWFYSGTVDFSTQFFNSYKSINSKEMKAALLTPVRFNAGIGLDYKYKKLISLMLSPVSYKFIYANDTVNVNKKSFGILPGEKILSQIGSTFRAQFSYSPTREIQFDSKLTFYTNYQKVEIDWEMIGNFTVNRYLSTRLSLNPRYDNTVILAAGEKAKIQFKELLTFGLSYKLL